MPPKLKYLLTIVLLTFLSQQSIGQVLKTTGTAISLNPGGRIYDMEYIPSINATLIVGNFTSVNGIPKNNLALIGGNNNAVLWTPSLNPGNIDVDATIRSVEYMNSGNKHYIILGGDFLTINFDGTLNSFKQGMAVLEATTTNLVTTTPFSLLQWDYATVEGNGSPGIGTGGNGVMDMYVSGDTLHVAGKIIGIDLAQNDHFLMDPLLGDITDACYFALKLNNSAPSRFNIITASVSPAITSGYLADGTYSIVEIPNGFAISTNPSINVQHRDNNFGVGTFIDIDESTATSDYFSSLTVLNDTVIIYTEKEGGSGGETIGAYSTNSYPNNTPGPVSNYEFGSPTDMAIQVYGQVAYNNDLIVFKGFGSSHPLGERNVVKRFDFNGETSPGNLTFTPMGAESTILPNVPSVTDFLLDTTNNFFLIGNRLFLSAYGITGANGLTRSGVAEFCLEPENPKEFTVFDTTICANEIGTYTIPASTAAEGYRWTYTGSNAEYRKNGTSNWFPFVNEIVTGTDGNSIEVRFNNGALSSGTISVEPYATCNTATDYLFADSQTGNITVVDIPNVSMADSTFLSCISDSAWVVLSSTTPGITPYIFRGIDTTFNDSILFDLPLPPLFTPGYYYGVVTEPVNLCSNMDSTWFSVDTAVPVFNSGNVTFSPPTFTCATSSMNINGTLTGTTIEWTNTNDPTIPLPNPFDIYSTDTTDFTAHVTNTANGCETDYDVFVQVDTSKAPGQIVGYPTMGIPLDSLSCNDPTLALTCQAINGGAEWIGLGSSTLSLTEADTAGMNNNVQIYSYETVHNTTGCSDDFEVVVYFDFDAPLVLPYTGNASINCSQSSAEVVHPISGNPVEGWLDQFGTQTNNDTLIASTPGDYYYQVEGTNGCLNADTVNIGQTLDMTVTMPADTLICPDASVSITAVPTINTGETPTFIWSDGSTTSAGSAVGGTNSELTVIVQTTSGCIGYDTTEILITPPIEAYFSSSSGCTSAFIEVDSLFGGNGNYEYSLDQTNWQSSSVFTGVSIGTIDIFIRDNLGCVYDFTETVIPSGTGPSMNILVATYNDLGDTTVTLSYGTSQAFDSLNWILPVAADVVFESDSLVAYSIDSEGWYDITLIGYQDTCQYSTTNSVYFGTKPIYDTAAIDNGIVTFTASPNPTTQDFFFVNAEFGASQPYSILVNSLDGQSLSGNPVSGNGISINNQQVNFPAGAAAGTYVVHLVGLYDAQQILIVKN